MVLRCLVNFWIWKNLTEAFHHSGLNSMEALTELNSDQVADVLARIYDRLDKRLATNQRFDWRECVDLLLSWLLHTYDLWADNDLCMSRNYIMFLSNWFIAGRRRARWLYLRSRCPCPLCQLASLWTSFAVSDSLCLLSEIDVTFLYFSLWADHYTLVCDTEGKLVPDKFECFLRDLLALAVGVFEGPNFSYNAASSSFCWALVVAVWPCGKHWPFISLWMACWQNPGHNACSGWRSFIGWLMWSNWCILCVARLVPLSHSKVFATSANAAQVTISVSSASGRELRQASIPMTTMWKNTPPG